MEIPKIELCKTPESYNEIMEFVDRLPEGERANATFVMMMTYNFVAEQVNIINDSVKQD